MAPLIDPRGHRFGAGLSVVILVTGFLAQVALVVPAIAAAHGISAVFATRSSLLGRPWPAVRRILRLGRPAELES
jgi:CBS-domain-containing membrane protein